MNIPAQQFNDAMRALEPVYVGSSVAMAQSGFSGGRQRWIEERSPLIAAIHRDGSFLDVGCANGLLAADVVDWSQERGFIVEAHGIDLGKRLINLAWERHPTFAEDFVMADAWSWVPNRTWTFVYSLLDLSPPDLDGAAGSVG